MVITPQVEVVVLCETLRVGGATVMRVCVRVCVCGEEEVGEGKHS